MRAFQLTCAPAAVVHRNSYQSRGMPHWWSTEEFLVKYDAVELMIFTTKTL